MNRIWFVVVTCVVMLAYAGRIEWGTAYVVNHSPYTVLITAEQTDAWDVVNHRKWSLLPGASEVLGRLDTLKHIHFQGQFDDPARAPSKLTGIHSIGFYRKKTLDLLIDINVNDRTGKWLVQPRYEGPVKVKQGGVSGYHLIAE